MRPSLSRMFTTAHRSSLRILNPFGIALLGFIAVAFPVSSKSQGTDLDAQNLPSVGPNSFRPPLQNPPPPLRPMNRVTPIGLPIIPDASDQERVLTRVTVLNVIYTNTCQDSFSQSEIDVLLEEVSEAEVFFFRHSNLHLDLVIETVVVDRYLSLDQFWLLYPPGGYWLPQWSMNGVNSVEQDLYDLGYQDGDLSGIFVWYAWANTSEVYAALGGGTYGVGAILGTASYSSVPLCWDPDTNDWYFLHEFHHQIDSMFDAWGYPEYPHADMPGAYYGGYDDGYSFNAWILNSWLEENWYGLQAPWGFPALVLDHDEDALPDSGQCIPLTEMLLQGNAYITDTDGDDLNDGDEAAAGLFAASDLNNPDTDSDGLQDGDDLYPLDAVVPEIFYGVPQLDGTIGPEEWGPIIDYPGSSDLSAQFYGLWDDLWLYFAVHVEDDTVSTPWAEPWWDDALYLRLDAMNDGFLAHGQDNYDLWAAPRGSSNQPTFSVVIVMPDGSFNEELVLESDLIGCYTRTAADYTLEIGIPTNVETGLYLYPAIEMGLQVEICDYDTYPGWPHTSLFTQFIDFTLSAQTGTLANASEPDRFQFSLSAYPQPMNAEALIQYSFPSRTRAELSVWNLLGQKLGLLDSGWRNGGQHQVYWKAEELPSGIYLLELVTDSHPDPIVSRVTLIK